MLTTTHPAPVASQNGFSTNPFALYEGLKSLAPPAICYLHHKTGKHLAAKIHLAKACSEDAEELTNDAVLLTLQKILNGAYTFQGFSPLTFALLIADNLLRNFCRKKRLVCLELEGLDLPAGVEMERCLHQKKNGSPNRQGAGKTGRAMPLAHPVEIF